ncbi:MAG: hypothetical protein AB7F75_10720 [Planctomycetota bacterium]
MGLSALKIIPASALVIGLLLRLAYIQMADIWIDEAATLHHVLHWDLERMALYNVNSGYYLLLQVLSDRKISILPWIAHALSLLALPLGWWMMGRQLEEEGRKPFWPQIFLVVWPPLFVFDCIMRPYALGVGLLFTAWHLMNTSRLSAPTRLVMLGLVTVLGVYTLYLNAIFYFVLALTSLRANRRSNMVLLAIIPFLCWPATWYVLEQNILHHPLIASTGEPDSWWRAFHEPWLFFRHPWPFGHLLALLLAVFGWMGMWATSRLWGYVLSISLMAGLLWVTNTSSFDRLYLAALVFVIPSLEPGSRKVLGKVGPPILLAILLLSMPWVLQRSVKINGAKAVARILENEWKDGDVVAVHSGFQSLPLYWLSGDTMRNSIITPFHPITTPEFYGLPRESTMPDEESWVRRALQARRVWIWGGTTALLGFTVYWPVEGQWEVESGGNGARVLELRRKP